MQDEDSPVPLTPRENAQVAAITALGLLAWATAAWLLSGWPA